MKCLLYVTKAKPYLFKDIRQFECMDEQGNPTGQYVSYFNGFDLEKENFDRDYLNGHIVAECEAECEEIYSVVRPNGLSRFQTDILNEEELLGYSCLTREELDNRLKEKNGCAIYNFELKAFDRPLELKEVYRKYDRHDYSPVYYMPLTKAPQNMMWVWYKGEKYCLISCSSNECANLFNGKQTILVRKKVLKEMI